MAPQMDGSFAPSDQSEVCEPERALTSSFRYGYSPRHVAHPRVLFWLVLFVFFTFCLFVVLFEYGTHDFAERIQDGIRARKDVGGREGEASEKKEEITSLFEVSRADELFVEHAAADDQANARDRQARTRFCGSFWEKWAPENPPAIAPAKDPGRGPIDQAFGDEVNCGHHVDQ